MFVNNNEEDWDMELRCPEELTKIMGNTVIEELKSTYTGGSAYVCVYNNGSLYASESACP